jgi:hypothetical protein
MNVITWVKNMAIILSCVWLSLGFGFTDHFNIQLVTTLNYRAIADLHTSQITTAHAKSFQSAVSSPVIPWQQLLTVEILQLPRSFVACWLPTTLTKSSLHRSLKLTLAPTVLLIPSQQGPCRKHCSLLYSNHFRGNMFICEGITQ